MKNISRIIKQHNVKILSGESNKKRSCNSRNKEWFPIKGHCLRECMVYEAEVQQKIISKYIMAHTKENLNLVFTVTRNDFEIEFMKRSFQSTLTTEGRIQKLPYKLANIYACNAPYIWHKTLRSMPNREILSAQIRNID